MYLYLTTFSNSLVFPFSIPASSFFPGILFPIMLHGEALPIATVEEVTLDYMRLEKTSFNFWTQETLKPNVKVRLKKLLCTSLAYEYLTGKRIFYIYD